MHTIPKYQSTATADKVITCSREYSVSGACQLQQYCGVGWMQHKQLANNRVSRC